MLKYEIAEFHAITCGLKCEIDDFFMYTFSMVELIVQGVSSTNINNSQENGRKLRKPDGKQLKRR